MPLSGTRTQLPRKRTSALATAPTGQERFHREEGAGGSLCFCILFRQPWVKRLVIGEMRVRALKRRDAPSNTLEHQRRSSSAPTIILILEFKVVVIEERHCLLTPPNGALVAAYNETGQSPLAVKMQPANANSNAWESLEWLD